MMGYQHQDGKLMIIMSLNGPNLHDVIFSEKHQVCVCVCVCVWALESTFGVQMQLSLTLKLQISVQLCQALVFMHTNTPPIAHLDIKPSNILVRSVCIIK